jgi:ubiquinone/menaquinone biosynthesis C-methylase UbiE
MKTIIHIVGVSCAGKSYYAEKLSEELNIPLLQIDNVYKPPAPHTFEEKMEKYKQFINIRKDDRLYIADGFMPFTHEEDMICFKNAIEDAQIVYMVVKPSFERYSMNIEERSIGGTAWHVLNKKEYKKRYEELDRQIGRKYILVEKEDDIPLKKRDILNLTYQHTGVTDVRWSQLKVNCKGKTVLDIGCCSGYYGIYAKNEGAKIYKGIDTEDIQQYVSEDIQIYNANCLEKWKERYDIVISTSMFHYITDKDKFIRECSRITKEVFILECPISLEEGEHLEFINGYLYKGLYLPTKGMIELWLGKYFKSFGYLGEGISENGSTRLIYKAYV